MDASDIAKLLGAKGGKTTVAKYGTDHMRKLAQKSAAARKKKRADK